MSDNKEQNGAAAIGYDKELFIKRVEDIMHFSKMDYDLLASKFGELGYSITSANLRTYITQRNLSLKVLIYLSKALNISMDYLVGNEVAPSTYLNENFDREIYGPRYAQYPGHYYVFFYPTRTNDPEELIKATLCIEKERGLLSTLQIPVSGGVPKIYTGHLVLSHKTNTAFLSMVGTHGEIIQLTFNDPNTNQNKLRLCVAALVSVSSGDTKRMPTLSRAIITEKDISQDGIDFIAANLRLNSKYIDIKCSDLQATLSQFLRQEGVDDAEEVCQRLQFAFKAKQYVSIEEQYFLNTFKNENSLTNLQTERLIAILRNHSLSDINNKAPRSIDTRLYLLMKDEGMFLTGSENEQKTDSWQQSNS